MNFWDRKDSVVRIPMEGSYSAIAREARPNPDVGLSDHIVPLSTRTEPPPCELPPLDEMQRTDPIDL